MNDPASLRRPAITLMRGALSMLDEAGEDLAAVHLQMAIDVAQRVSSMKPGEKLWEDKIDTSTPAPQPRADPALVRAVGAAVAVFATVMARQGGASVDETADLLGIYAAVTKERSVEEGLLIACWAAMLRDVAEAMREQS